MSLRGKRIQSLDQYRIAPHTSGHLELMSLGSERTQTMGIESGNTDKHGYYKVNI